LRGSLKHVNSEELFAVAPVSELLHREFVSGLVLGILASSSAIAASGFRGGIGTLFFDDFSAPLSTNNWDYNPFMAGHSIVQTLRLNVTALFSWD
jgi:hypothetical protein